MRILGNEFREITFITILVIEITLRQDRMLFVWRPSIHSMTSSYRGPVKGGNTWVTKDFQGFPKSMGRITGKEDQDSAVHGR